MVGDLIGYAAGMGVTVTQAQAELLIEYLNLIEKWNRVHNLTAVRDTEKMLSHHILDSLSVQPYLTCKNLLDVGSGAGLPGIPLAIINPDVNITLADSNKKKSAFQSQAVIELGLSNVVAISGRIEAYKPDTKFDGIISRAFSEIEMFVAFTRHLLAKDGYWYAMKGILPEAELAALPEDVSVFSLHELNVGLLNAQRHLVILKAVNG